jgi:hypothetical protein
MNPINRRQYVLPAFILVVFFALLIGFFLTLKNSFEPPQESVSAVGPPEYVDPNANPIQANIGVYIISVGNLDLATGNYFMDFYLTIRCDRSCQPDPDILNAASAPEITRQNADTQGDTFHFYRVRANLLTDVYLDNFPFDEQVLRLSIGDKQATKSEMEFIDDPDLTGWDYGHIHLLGWLVKQKLDTNLTEDAYPAIQNGLYSRYNLSVRVFKPWLSSFISDIFPVVVIMLVGLLSFLMSLDAAGERLALTSSTLLALILFHINLNSSLPPLSSLTYADKFMLVNYVTASISTAISAIILVLKDNEHLEAARRLNSWTRWVVPPLWALLLLAITIWQFNGAQIATGIQK